MLVAPGIYRLRIPMPDALAYTDAYAVRAGKGWVLFDTGMDTPGAFEVLQTQAKEDGIDLRGISLIVLSHTHNDHYGLAARLKDVSGATLAFHPAEDALIRQRYINGAAYFKEWSQQLRDNGMPEEMLPSAQPARARGPAAQPPAILFADRAINDGEIIAAGDFNLQVYWTPGHSPGHVCLYEPRNRILFAGDHILSTTIPNVSYPQPVEDPLGKYLASLRRLAALDVRLTLPAHENTITDLPGRVAEIVRYRERRLEAIMKVLQEGPRTPYETAARIPWLIKKEGDPGTAYKDLAIWDKRLALGETTSHLELLRGEGKVRRERREGAFVYSVAGG